MVEIGNFKGVLVLYNHSSSLIKGAQIDLLSDQDVVNCAGNVADALRSLSVPVKLAPIQEEVELLLADHSPEDWLIFNLAEGFRGRIYEEARIAWLLELKGYYFTGACGRSLALTTNKALTKFYLSKIGLHTPDWWLFRTAGEIPRAGNFPFPLIVKPVAEDASLGIELNSIVTNLNSLRERAEYIIRTYQQAALVEEFIDGREFNIAAWGHPPELLPVAEIEFQGITSPQARIVNYAAKWQDSSYEFHHTPAICPADVSPALNRLISRTALGALDCTGVKSYARVDLRLSDREIPYILEINCNPDISPGAGFANSAKAAGLSYQEMIHKILSLARRPSDEYYPIRKPRRRGGNRPYHGSPVKFHIH